MSVLQNATKTDKGVMVNGFVVSPIVDKCEGCGHVCEFEGEKFCSSYPTPSRQGSGGRCNFATHIKVEAAAAQKVNPLKASKRAAKGH